ncbi:MAG: type II toxin-antitoxin system RelE/ParE family toxin [Xanthomonadales bacterium]|nr:type II toxin-antitoxin system RelE/ParE family toxin [Xanthomonadales bacterium]
MKVKFTDSAIEDIQDILSWYTSQLAPDIGQQLVTEIIERAQTLADHPNIGRVVPEYANPNIRELIHPPLRVIYEKDKSLIAIVRVWRSERMLQLP